MGESRTFFLVLPLCIVLHQTNIRDAAGTSCKWMKHGYPRFFWKAIDQKEHKTKKQWILFCLSSVSHQLARHLRSPGRFLHPVHLQWASRRWPTTTFRNSAEGGEPRAFDHEMFWFLRDQRWCREGDEDVGKSYWGNVTCWVDLACLFRWWWWWNLLSTEVSTLDTNGLIWTDAPNFHQFPRSFPKSWSTHPWWFTLNSIRLVDQWTRNFFKIWSTKIRGFLKSSFIAWVMRIGYSKESVEFERIWQLNTINKYIITKYFEWPINARSPFPPGPTSPPSDGNWNTVKIGMNYVVWGTQFLRDSNIVPNWGLKLKRSFLLLEPTVPYTIYTSSVASLGQCFGIGQNPKFWRIKDFGFHSDRNRPILGYHTVFCPKYQLQDVISTYKSYNPISGMYNPIEITSYNYIINGHNCRIPKLMTHSHADSSPLRQEYWCLILALLAEGGLGKQKPGSWWRAQNSFKKWAVFKTPVGWVYGLIYIYMLIHYPIYWRWSQSIMGNPIYQPI